MGRIPEYTRGIIKPRQTPNLVDFGAIQDAGATAKGVADVSGMAADVVNAHNRANEATAVNDAVIAKQKDDMEYLDQVRKQNESNPFGFAKRIEPDITKRDQERAKALPSEAARKAYFETSKRLNLGIYESNFSWENTRKTQIYASRVKSSVDNNNLLALRAGRDGMPLDEYLKNVDATTVASGGVFAPEQVMALNQDGRSQAAAFWIDGVNERNPFEAEKVLNSGKLDRQLGADGLQRAYKAVEVEKARREKAAKDAIMNENFLNGKRPPDPSNKEDRKIIDMAYAKSGLLDAFQSGDPAAMTETVNLISETSIIPNAVQSTLRGYIENGNEQQKSMAYSVIGNIQEVKPAALSGPAGFTAAEIKDAAAYNSLIRSGATPRFADEAVKQANSPMQTDIRNYRETELNAIMKDITPETIQDEYGKGVFNLNPDFMGSQNEARIFADYKNIYREEYLRYGNKKSAEAAAIAAVRINNGETYITGGEKLMQFPPENYYGVPRLTLKENAEWMREELKTDLSGFGFKGDLDKVSLVPTLNSQARIDQGLKPQYHAFVETDRDGFPVIDILLDDKNQPVTIAFDNKKASEKSVAKREKEVQDAAYGRSVEAGKEFYGTPTFGRYITQQIVDFTRDKNLEYPIVHGLMPETEK